MSTFLWGVSVGAVGILALILMFFVLNWVCDDKLLSEGTNGRQ
jgi:hypothetical protein